MRLASPAVPQNCIAKGTRRAVDDFNGRNRSLGGHLELLNYGLGYR